MLSIGAPATAKNAICVGASNTGSFGSEGLAYFSSRGPASDGRFKPDLVAPGYVPSLGGPVPACPALPYPTLPLDKECPAGVAWSFLHSRTINQRIRQ